MSKARKRRQVTFACTECNGWKHVLLPRTWMCFRAVYKKNGGHMWIRDVPWTIRCGSCYWAEQSK